MSAPLLLSDAVGAKASDDPPPASFDFELPDALSASAPPEARGLARDAVRLMVSRVDDDTITHTGFQDLPTFLAPDDVLVVNASATINAALDAWREADGARSGEHVALHLASPLPDGRWIVELRRLTTTGHAPLRTAQAGERLRLREGGAATLVEPFLQRRERAAPDDPVRLWIAEVACSGGVPAFAARHGSPIRYDYVRVRWPLSYNQTIFATEPGSAEMPSAGRAFTGEIVARLTRLGVRIVPLVLHTGVSSPEWDEPPYPERYRVPAGTADSINRARSVGGRVIAVGTTVVRALETVASPNGRVRGGAGWTDLVITPERGVYAVDAILTGLHAPRASHLAMLESLAGRHHLAHTYDAALRHRYLWHEFGDLHLIVGGRSTLPR